MSLNTRENIICHVLLAKQKNRAGFAFLLNTFWKDVLKFQINKGNPHARAEDLTIETFSRAFDKIESFDINHSFKNWLLAISRNLYVDMLRKSKDEAFLSLNENYGYEKSAMEDYNYEEEFVMSRQLEKLLEGLKKLKPEHRLILQMHYFQEMSYKEIAETLNEKLTSVKVKSHRARKRLEELLS